MFYIVAVFIQFSVSMDTPTAAKKKKWKPKSAQLTEPFSL
jgi:hypothetical protein